MLTDLDAVGNTTKAITKGIAIATAVLAATALFGSFTDAVQDRSRRHRRRRSTTTSATCSTPACSTSSDPKNLVGLIIGASVVFMFSGLAINAVTRAAGAIVFEVRRQFREIPGIMDGTGSRSTARSSTSAPATRCASWPPRACWRSSRRSRSASASASARSARYLAGAIATGTLMAVFLANSGGAWDNAKKMVEDGAYGGKGSPAHEATVIGDTVGDPFKDTAGPAINPLIKVMNLVSLLIAPAIVSLSIGDDASTPLRILVALVAAAIIVGAVVSPSARASRSPRRRTKPASRRSDRPSRPVLRRTPAPTGCARRSSRPATPSTASRSCSVRRRRPRWAGTRRCRPGGPPRTADRSRRLVRLFLLQQDGCRRRTSPPCCRWTSRCPSACSAPTVTRSAPASIVRPYAAGGRRRGRALVGGVRPRDRPRRRRSGRSPASTCSAIGGASTTLAQLTPRDPVGRTLDVGTGSGVQALHAEPAQRRRSSAPTCPGGRVQLAGLTAALSGGRGRPARRATCSSRCRGSRSTSS